MHPQHYQNNISKGNGLKISKYVFYTILTKRLAYSSSTRIRNRYWERHLDAIKNCSPAAAASFSHCVSYNAQWVLRQQDEQGIWFLHFTILIQLICAFRYTDMNTYTDKFTFLEMYLSGKNELKCVEKYMYWGKTHLKLDAFLSISFLKKKKTLSTVRISSMYLVLLRERKDKGFFATDLNIFSSSNPTSG